MDRIGEIKQYITSNYDIDYNCTIELLADIGNFVYSIKDGSQLYIFRIFATLKSISAIESEIELLNFLKGYNLSIEAPIINCNGLYLDTIKLNNSVWNCAMYSGFQGVIYDEILTSDQSQKLGLLTGNLHNALDAYSGKSSFSRLGFEELILIPWQRIKPYVLQNKELHDFYETVIMKSMAKLKKHENHLSWGICHGDLHAGNVIFNNEPGLFDFDLCCHGWRLYDLATFIWSVIPREDYSKETLDTIEVSIKSFLNGYMIQRKLSSVELELLYNIVLLRHIWRQADRINFEKHIAEWQSEKHFIVQMNRMKKWIEQYGISF